MIVISTWKIVAVLLWAWIPFLWQPLRGQTPGVGVHPGHNQEQTAKPYGSNANPDQRGTPTSPFIVETHPRADNPEEAEEHKAENDIKEYRDRWTFNLTVFNAIIAIAVAIFTGLLVCVGWRGVRAAVRTLDAIERQAHLMQEQLIDTREANATAKSYAQANIVALEAQRLAMAAQVDLMKRQADLAQAQFDQWVDLENWHVDKRPDRFIIRVDLINHTAFPVTLDEGELTIGENGGPRGTTCLLGVKTFLSPNQPQPIDFNIGSWVLPDQLASLPAFKVKGAFSHRHRITKEEIKQPLEGLLQCEPWASDHKWHAVYTPLIHMNPERTQTDNAGKQKAN